MMIVVLMTLNVVAMELVKGKVLKSFELRYKRIEILMPLYINVQHMYSMAIMSKPLVAVVKLFLERI
jgi:hypothetical protein